MRRVCNKIFSRIDLFVLSLNSSSPLWHDSVFSTLIPFIEQRKLFTFTCHIYLCVRVGLSYCESVVKYPRASVYLPTGSRERRQAGPARRHRGRMWRRLQNRHSRRSRLHSGLGQHSRLPEQSSGGPSTKVRPTQSQRILPLIAVNCQSNTLGFLWVAWVRCNQPVFSF